MKKKAAKTKAPLAAKTAGRAPRAARVPRVKAAPVAPGAASLEAPPAESLLGWRIRSLRRRKGMTLQQLAEMVSLDRGHISRLERGEKSPSIGTLQAIAHGLGASVSSLLGEADPHQEVHVVRGGNRRRMAASAEAGAHVLEVVTSSETGGELEMYIITVGAIGSRTVAHHAGDEVLYVLEGRVQMRFGAKEMTLARGDSARFPGYLPHSMWSAGAKPARVLVAVVGGS
jgi:transcriptional regulator with XRE-family HTH domain